MKTTTMILATVFTLAMNVLFAGNNGAPVTSTIAIIAAVNLAPLAPVEADFSDAISETTIDIFTLAPVTPSEADFASDDETTNVSVFAPVTPSVADFSDGI